MVCPFIICLVLVNDGGPQTSRRYSPGSENSATLAV
jgi:hypothetical protein